MNRQLLPGRFSRQAGQVGGPGLSGQNKRKAWGLIELTGNMGWAKCAAAAIVFHAAVLSIPLSFSKVSHNVKERLIGVVLVREETPLASPVLKAKQPRITPPPSWREARTELPAPKGVPAPTNQAAGQIERKGESGSHGAGNGPDEHIASQISPGPSNSEGAGIAGANSAGGNVGIGSGVSGNGPGSGGHGTGSGGRGGPVEARFSDVDGPRFVHHEPPEYPPGARRLGREGKVVLVITIDEKGKPIGVDVVEATDQRFARSAMEALKKSTFLPAKRNGVPVVSRATLPVRFAIEQ